MGAAGPVTGYSLDVKLVRVAAAASVLCASAVAGQGVEVAGLVTDSATGAALPHARAEWSNRATRSATAAYTDAAGRFRVQLAPGRYDVLLTRIGYRAVHMQDREIVGASSIRVALPARGIPVDPIVISGARSEQARLDAPVAISVIGRAEIEEGLPPDPLHQIRTLPGVDFASKGLLQATVSARGPRTPSSRALLMLTDNIYTEVPAVLAVSFARPTTREDIERIEVVRGPAAALYGPGAPQGIIHVVTRSPFESFGGAASLSAGGRSILQGTTRYAGRIHPSLAMSVSADYFDGDDWAVVDSFEIDNRAAAIARGADPDTLRIARRDHHIRRAGGEARLDWRPGLRTEIVTKAGVAEAANGIDLTGLGAVQLQQWRSWYVQSRLKRDRFMLNTVVGANDAGDTYYLRTGAPLVEQSRMLGVQVQHGAKRGALDVVYGSDMRATDPRTGGTVHGAY
ncbi:MAG: TonB-dependent receptor, partial [Gemmatimonadota bacterium]|nr:TonB-dependent receptor [Gemmatimonadota bacterium]